MHGSAASRGHATCIKNEGLENAGHGAIARADGPALGRHGPPWADAHGRRVRGGDLHGGAVIAQGARQARPRHHVRPWQAHQGRAKGGEVDALGRVAGPPHGREEGRAAGVAGNIGVRP